jgi:hypothetical protein
MENTQSDKDSYSYWEFQLICGTKGWNLPIDELTENGKHFVALYTHLVLYWIGVPLALLTAILFSIILHTFEFQNLPAYLQSIVGIITLCLIVIIPVVAQFLMLPNIGMIIHDRGYLTDEELQVMLKRRIPKSIFLDPNKPLKKSLWY